MEEQHREGFVAEERRHMGCAAEEGRNEARES